MEIWGSFNEKWKIKIKRTMRINEGKTGKKENYGMTQEKNQKYCYNFGHILI